MFPLKRKRTVFLTAPTFFSGISETRACMKPTCTRRKKRLKNKKGFKDSRSLF
jgi:hypothetical protein